MPSFYNAVVVLASSGALAVLVLLQKERFGAHAKSREEKKRSYINWDHNWDHMAPLPREGKEEREGERGTKPTASRHLILIRHGKYNKDKKVLTELGQHQAIATG